MCQRGDARFRRAAAKHCAARVRACVAHRGPPDEHRGDAPHEAVRDQATEAIAAMFPKDEVRSIHWSPYDPVRVVDADP